MLDSLPGTPQPLFLLLLAIVIDVAAGGLTARLLPAPAEWSRRLCARLDRRLNRSDRSDRDRLLRGALVVALLVAVAVAVGLGVEWAAGAVANGWILVIVALLAILRGRAAWAETRAVRRALETAGLTAARVAVTDLTRRPANGLDEHAVARAAVEHVARAFDRKLVAPAFWFALLGLPGALAWAVVEGADTALGNTGAAQGSFGLTAARLEDALNALPARFAALLLGVAAGFIGGASLPDAFRTMGRDSRASASLNMGWPVAAMAGSLGLALGGPHRDGGVTVSLPWIGDGRARALPADIGRALALTAVATLLLVLTVGLLMVAAQRV